MSYMYKTQNRLLNFLGLVVIVVFGVISTLGTYHSEDSIPVPVGSYNISGTAYGATGPMKLQLNDNLEVITVNPGSDGRSVRFHFLIRLNRGQTYTVEVAEHPPGQTCVVTNGTGITDENFFIDDIEVTCADNVNPGPGEPDTSFNSVGYITHHNAAGGNGLDRGLAVVTNAGNSIFVAGQSALLSMVIWKYDVTGVLDGTFGSGGIVIDHDAAGGISAYGEAIALGNSGTVFVAGTAVTGPPLYEFRMALWKYDAFGVPDNAFDTDGVVVSGESGFGYAMAIDTSGVTDKIVVLGEADTGAGLAMALWRFNANDGSADNSFDTDGLVTLGVGDGIGYSVVVDSSGNIIVTGESTNSNGKDMTVWRFLPNGALDTSFDTDGIFIHNGAAGGNADDVGYALKLDASNRIVVAGSSFGPGPSASEEVAVWRINSNGTLDTSFDSDGVAIYVGGDSTDRGNGLAFDSQNRIVVTGIHDTFATVNDMALWRFNTDGSHDTSFGNNGMVTHHNAAGGSGMDQGADVTLDSSGKIVVTGYSEGASDYDMAIWRFTP